MGMVLLYSTVLAYTEMKTGFYLAIGQMMHYNSKNFSNGDQDKIITEPADLFLGAWLYFPNKVEFSVVYNRAKGKFLLDQQRFTYDKDGLGLEVGKIITIKLFTKESYRLSLDFIAGAYTIIYFYKKIESEGSKYQSPSQQDNLQYQWGFYWSIRIKNGFNQKASFDLGFKSLLPAGSNEFISREGHRYFLFKSFIYLGISF